MTNRALALAALCALAVAIAACDGAKPAAGSGAAASEACVACHGGTDGSTGAPPKDTKGHVSTTEVSVGAHTAHVSAGPLAGPFDCDACHVKPATVSAPGHLDGAQMIVWGGLAVARGASPTWDRASATCSNVYCHGATLLGGTRTSASWITVDGTQAACGACHGLPPANHPTLAVGSTTATCNACHPETVKADGTVDAARGRHVNGIADGFGGHPNGWLDRASTNFHAGVARSDDTACQACHALAEPARVSTVTCSRCHPDAGAGDFTSSCIACHGSGANPAPPRDLSGNVATTARGVGAHQSHVRPTRGFAGPMGCESCHVMPRQAGDPGHMDGAVQVTGYTGSDPALASAVKDPGWTASTTTCATSYCHGASPALGGGTVPYPAWTIVDGGQVSCGSCHGLPPAGHPALAAGSDAKTCSVCHPETVRPDGTIDVAGGLHVNGRADGFAGHPGGWMTKSSPDFHGRLGAGGIAACMGCHEARRPARGSAITCATCHDFLASGDWVTTCSGCHGSRTNAAPPKDLAGNTSTTSRGVGAHQSHVTGAHGVSAPLDCVHCHRKPTTAVDSDHMNGVLEVTGYTGSDANMAVAIPVSGWNGATLTCTNYCHGASLGGGTVMQPVWTRVDGSQMACGSCHGLPPPNHITLTPPVTAGACATCHPATVRADGAIDVVGGKHVNGKVETAGFSGHGAGWLVPTDLGFHGLAVVEQGLYGCLACHSANEPGMYGIRSCASCHDTLAGGADWTASCAGCHGSSASAAPPRDLRGNTTTTVVGVGAHRSHLTGAHSIAAPLDCTACHPAPVRVVQRPHADGGTDVTGYTGNDRALLAAVTAPGWDRIRATCATAYCHGATLGGGTASAPVWTRVDGTQVACGGCHGLPPPRHMTLSPPVTAANCSACHPATVKPDGTIDVPGGKHVNGTVEANGFAGHGPGWMVAGEPDFHGQAATSGGMDACFACHSPKEPATNGVPSCASCHDALAGGVDWTTSCVGCHGSGTVSAPPRDIHGNTATTAVGVGAHRSHVEATHGLAQRYDCSVCHQKPSVVFSPGHLDGRTLVTGYTGSDPGLRFVTDPGWNRTTATCSTSWCHGDYSGTYTWDFWGQTKSVSYAGLRAYPNWTQVDGTQGRCGTCHDAPPRNAPWHIGHNGGTQCNLCHPGVKSDGTGFVDAFRHVDGVVDVEPRYESACFDCH